LQVKVFNFCNTSYTSQPITLKVTIPQDLDKDGEVDIDDYLLFVPKFGFSCACPEDYDENGTVNIDDFLLFAPAFGRILY
jgi:hypothetical protein